MSDLTGLSQAALSKIIVDQQARIEELEEVAQRRLEYIYKKNERIEELEAQVRLRDAQVAFYKELEAIPRDEADGFNKIIAHYQAQVKELKAELIATFDEYNSTGKLSTVRCLKAAAALQENNNE